MDTLTRAHTHTPTFPHTQTHKCTLAAAGCRTANDYTLDPPDGPQTVCACALSKKGCILGAPTANRTLPSLHISPSSLRLHNRPTNMSPCILDHGTTVRNIPVRPRRRGETGPWQRKGAEEQMAASPSAVSLAPTTTTTLRAGAAEVDGSGTRTSAQLGCQRVPWGAKGRGGVKCFSRLKESSNGRGGGGV